MAENVTRRYQKVGAAAGEVLVITGADFGPQRLEFWEANDGPRRLRSVIESHAATGPMDAHASFYGYTPIRQTPMSPQELLAEALEAFVQRAHDNVQDATLDPDCWSWEEFDENIRIIDSAAAAVEFLRSL